MVEETNAPPLPVMRGDDADVLPGVRPRSLVWPIILALLVTGAGQIMNRQYLKGFTCFLFHMFLNFGFALVVPIAPTISQIGPNHSSVMFTASFTGRCLGFILSVLALVDTILIGRRLQRGEVVCPWQFF